MTCWRRCASTTATASSSITRAREYWLEEANDSANTLQYKNVLQTEAFLYMLEMIPHHPPVIPVCPPLPPTESVMSWRTSSMGCINTTLLPPNGINIFPGPSGTSGVRGCAAVRAVSLRLAALRCLTSWTSASSRPTWTRTGRCRDSRLSSQRTCRSWRRNSVSRTKRDGGGIIPERALR